MAELTIEITPHCILNCIHCSHDKTSEEKVDHTGFENGEVERVIQEYDQFETVRFSGGEPFTENRLAEYAEYAKRRSKKVHIVTSGVCGYRYGEPGDSLELTPLTQRILLPLKGLVNNISFSLYGAERIHDTITRTPGSFKCLDKSVKEVISLGIPFSFTSVALRTAIPGIEDVIRYVAIKKRVSGTNPRVHYLRFIKQGNGEESLRQALTPEEIIEFRERASFFAKRYEVDVSFGCSLKEEGCNQGVGKAAVSSSGEYFPCSALKFGGKTEAFGCRERW